jgi:hypothetical protein
MTETDKKSTSISRIIELFNEIETTPRKKEDNFKAIKEIVDNILKEKGINKIADELEIIYNTIITDNPRLKDWVEDFLLINYEKDSNFFLYTGADYGGKRKSRKSKKSRKSRKSKKSYNKKRKSRKTKKY